MCFSLRPASLRPGVAVLCAGLAACGDGATNPGGPGPVATGGLFTVSGVVLEVRPEGRSPLAGARVALLGQANTATSDSNGYYQLAGVRGAPASVVVMASRDGYVQTSTSVMILGNVRVDFELRQTPPSPSPVLSGVVTEKTPDGSRPLAGVHVENSNNHESVITDDQGFYRLSHIEGGSVALYVRKEGYETLLLHMAVPQSGRFDIQLVRR